MLSELAKNINKKVTITLINGKEKQGIIVSLDAESNSIRIRDEKNNIIPILVSIVAMVEPLDILDSESLNILNRADEKKQIHQIEIDSNKMDHGILQKTITIGNEPNSDVPNDANKQRNRKKPNNDKSEFSNNNGEVLQMLTRIEITLDTEIKNAILQIAPPDFTTPSDIINTDFRFRQEKLRKWDWIKNKYDYARRTGRLVPNSDELRAIIDMTKSLTESHEFPNSSVLFSYLGYFHHIDNNKTESIKTYLKAAKLSGKPQDWLNLAAVASGKNENEMTCYALGKLFLQVDCTAENQYEKAWYKFSELVIQYSAYNAIGAILDNTSRILLREEQQKVFETICYFLLKKGQKKIAETQVQNSISGKSYKNLALQCLEILPQYPIESYNICVSDIERLAYKLATEVKKPTQRTTPIYNAKKTFVNDSQLHREALRVLRNEKDYIKAEKLFRKAIDRGINKQSAVRDLAMMLDQQRRTKEAIELVERHTDNSEADKNLLYNFNYKAGNYDKAIGLQKELIKIYNNYLRSEGINEHITSVKNKKVTMYMNLASCYLKIERYKEVENNYKEALKFNPNNYTLKRNIAICHYKQGNVELAKSELQKIVSEYADGKSIELLNAINLQSQNPNADNQAINIIIANTLALYSIDLSKFAHFYLDRCDYKGIPPERIEHGKYIARPKDLRYDLEKLGEAATVFGTKRPEDRSRYYLSAAKIVFDSEEKDNLLYRYLCKSFTSRADQSVYDRLSLDTIKTFYLESLKLYDCYHPENQNDHSQFDEQDAVNALYRYLYSHLGISELQKKVVAIHVGSRANQLKQIKDSCEDVFNKNLIAYQNYNNIFEAIKLAVSRSPQYASKRLLSVIYDNSHLRQNALEYLHDKLERNVPQNDLTFEQFAKLWNELSISVIQEESNFFEQINILSHFQLSEIWLRNAIETIKCLSDKVIFNFDSDYLTKLQTILDSCISLCNTTNHDEKISRCERIEQRSKNFLNEIEKNPTKLSIEEIHPIINNLLSELKDYFNDLNQKSKPELLISSAIASYHPKRDDQIDLQVKIENTAEGHAEQVELLIESNNNFYRVLNHQTIAYGTIRGKNKETQIIPLKLTEKAIVAKAFSLKCSAVFKTRQGEDLETAQQEIPIQLGDTKDFLEINPNPYAQWARGKKVVKKEMFFGREEFIKRAYGAICNNYRSYVIYGQFRSGKSSVLHHLEGELKNNSQILVADIGDVGRLMDDNSPTPLLYQMLFGILRVVYKNIKVKERKGFSKLDFTIPASQEFYGHPAPLDFFYEIFDNLIDEKNFNSAWQDIRIVVSMDEFTYLYEKIVQGKLSQDFMKNWKALLDANYFNVVLVAQDVFPKFRNKYDNTFQTMQHERVNYLEEPDAKALIDKPIRIKNDNGLTESRFTEKEAIRRILELTAASPYYIQIFCNQLVDYINNEKQPYITKANVNIVKDQLLRGDKRLDKTAFTNLVNNGDPSDDAMPHSDLIEVLKNIAEHTKNDEYCSRDKINCVTKTELNEILRDLEDRDIIEKHAEKGFRIRVGLFKEWLNENPTFME